MNRFLLAVSGTDPEVLARTPRDRPRQSTLGAAILFTAALAAFSATFALHIALGMAWVPAAVGGLVWGLGILSLDRWLIVNSKRQRTLWGNIRLALPRFTLAIIIGAVVSTPLTLQIFDKEIQAELQVMRQEDQAAFDRSLEADPRFADLDQRRDELAQLQADSSAAVSGDDVQADPTVAGLTARLAAVQAQLDDAEQAVICEREGTCGSNVVGAGPAFAEKLALRDSLRAEKAQLQQSLAAATETTRESLEGQATERRATATAQADKLEAEVTRDEGLRQDLVEAQQTASQNDDGLLARLTALHRIGEEDQLLLVAHLLLFVFFTALESLPVLFKLLLNLGAPTLYERLSELSDEYDYNEEQRRIWLSEEQAEIGARHAIGVHRQRLESQADAETETLAFVRAAQRGLATEAIDGWREEQSRRIAEDPSSVVAQGARTQPVTQPMAWPADAWSADGSPDTEVLGEPTPEFGQPLSFGDHRRRR